MLLNVPIEHDPPCFKGGLPFFDEQGFYAGPLERISTASTLTRQSQAFATTGTEEWASKLCRWVATTLFSCFLHHRTASSEGETGPLDQLAEEEDVGYPVNEPEGSRLLGGVGPCREVRLPGKVRPYHDGAGLVSAGRWDPDRRVWEEDEFWISLRARSLALVVEAAGGEQELDATRFRMAAKGEKGCNLVKNEKLLEGLRGLWIEMLSSEGLRDPNLGSAAAGQPFYLRLMRGLLARANDPDREFLLQGEEGYPVRVLNPLPRTPHMYEEQTSWKLEDEPWIREEVWRANYSSVAEHEGHVREHFDTECREGLMEKLSLEEATKRYGKRLAIASLEEAHNGKKRVIHDASHGVKVNNRIRCRGAREPGKSNTSWPTTPRRTYHSSAWWGTSAKSTKGAY